VSARAIPKASRLGDVVRTALAFAVAGGLIASVRAPLAERERRVKETSDVYVLPGPDEVVRLSLGYRAALADYLWASVLVTQGLRTQEKRRFENLTRYIDAINALDPQFRDPYRLADALITFQANTTPHAEVLKVREILERGVKNRPLDGELWLGLGQFLAFIAPASKYLESESETQEWREAGARYLARAAELGGENANISWQAIGGVGILNRAGERDAAIRFLRRTLAVTDDDELKEKIRPQLEALMGEEQRELYQRREAAFVELWREDLPFVSKAKMLLLGPPPNPAYCAGGAHALEAACATTWRERAERE
jgi:tetratricopeptide (TPR) repeat protein